MAMRATYIPEDIKKNLHYEHPLIEQMRTRNQMQVDNFLRTDALSKVRSFFLKELMRTSITKPRTHENIVDVLSDMLKAFRDTHQADFSISQVLPINVHSKHDGSLIWLMSSYPETRLKLQNDPEFLLRSLNIYDEYFWAFRAPSIKKEEPLNNKHFASDDKYLAYACEYLRNKLDVKLVPRHFTVKDGIVRPSEHGLSLVNVPNMIKQMQEAYEDALIVL